MLKYEKGVAVRTDGTITDTLASLGQFLSIHTDLLYLGCDEALAAWFLEDECDELACDPLVDRADLDAIVQQIAEYIQPWAPAGTTFQALDDHDFGFL